MFLFFVIVSHAQIETDETIIELDDLESIDEPLKGEPFDEKLYNFTFLEEENVPIVSYRNKSLIYGFLDAYMKHKSITIASDAVWLMVVQAFSYHTEKI